MVLHVGGFGDSLECLYFLLNGGNASLSLTNVGVVLDVLAHGRNRPLAGKMVLIL